MLPCRSCTLPRCEYTSARPERANTTFARGTLTGPDGECTICSRAKTGRLVRFMEPLDACCKGGAREQRTKRSEWRTSRGTVAGLKDDTCDFRRISSPPHVLDYAKRLWIADRRKSHALHRCLEPACASETDAPNAGDQVCEVSHARFSCLPLQRAPNRGRDRRS